MNAVQSASPTHAEDCAQQAVSMHASHVGAPEERPHDGGDPGGGGGGGGGGGDPGPPHTAQFVVTHDDSELSSVAPAGCAAWHAFSHTVSLQPSRQLMKSRQSASLMHALMSPQHDVSRH